MLPQLLFSQSRSLDYHLNQYKSQYNLVLNARGMGDINPEYFSLEDIKDYLAYMDGAYVHLDAGYELVEDIGLSSYLLTSSKGDTLKRSFAIEQAERHSRLHHVALLFYAYDEESRSLNLWVINKAGIHHSGSAKISAEDLIRLERQYYLHLKQQSGSIVNRGVFVEDQDEPELLSDADQSIADILFPDSTAFALANYNTLLVSPVLNIGTLPWYCIRPFGEGAQMVDYWNVQILESLNHMSIVARIDLYGDLQYKYKALGYQSKNYEYMRNRFEVENPVIIGNPRYGNCRLPSLKGAEVEAKYLADQLSSKVLGNNEALLENFTTDDMSELPYYPDKYRWSGSYFKGNLLYFATHAISSSDYPMDSSFIYLSSQRDECNTLSAKEILHIKKLPETLVIMSACESGKGRTVTGGVVGLARSFLINGTNEGYGNSFYGARNVVMSLWSIDDQSTTDLMKLFLEELQTEQSYWPVSPLRQAILRYREFDPDPLHWGAFQSMGLAYPGTMLMKL